MMAALVFIWVSGASRWFILVPLGVWFGGLYHDLLGDYGPICPVHLSITSIPANVSRFRTSPNISAGR